MIKIDKRDAPKHLLKPCKFTVHSSLSNNSYTYLIKNSKYGNVLNVYYVSRRPVFIGSYIVNDGYFSISRLEIHDCRLTKRSRVANIIFKNIKHLNDMDWLTVFVECKCQRCGRVINDLDSVERGYGRICYKKMMEEQNDKFNIR